MNAQTPVEVKKVAIVGPECTGKSDLAAFLASHYKTTWVPEYARGYIDNLINPYTQADLTTIAHGQLRLEETWMQDANKLLICDTNLVVIKIWSEVKFGETDQAILESMAKQTYDLQLLTYIDIPWEEDPQREHPDKREHLYELYLKEVSAMSIPFVEIRGNREQRQALAIAAIDKLLATNS